MSSIRLTCLHEAEHSNILKSILPQKSSQAARLKIDLRFEDLKIDQISFRFM